MTKKIAILSLTFAVVAALTVCSTAQPDPAPLAACGFTKVMKSSVGMPTSVSPSTIVLAWACCSGDFCVYVAKQADCDFPNEVFYCTVGQSNLDGTVTCFD